MIANDQAVRPCILSDDLPEDVLQAAHWWRDFDLAVAPMDPATKHTRLKWDEWLPRLERDGHKAIDEAFRADDWLCAIVDDSVLVLDADTPEAEAAAQAIFAAHDVQPNLTVKTRNGFHHYFRRAPGTYAKMQGHSSDKHPERIDIRTARSANDGRSVIVLPPSPGKAVQINEADTVADLVEVGQDFIDAIFRHNGQDAPRPPEPRTEATRRRTVGSSEAAEILSHIPPDCGYSDWLTVLMGVHERFDGSDDGLHLIDEWSSGAGNYCGASELEYKYQTFSARADGVTFSSVCKLAEQHGADLAAIASRYDSEGNRIPSYDEAMQAAVGLSQETPPRDVEAVVKMTGTFTAVEQRHIFNAIKRQTGIPLGVLKDAVREASGIESLDDLELARHVLHGIGRENILGCEGGVYGWDQCGVWRRLDDRTVKQLVQTGIEEKAADLNASLVSSVADLAKTEIHRPGHQFNLGEPETVNCLNGELVRSESGWGLQPHRREHYRTAQIPVRYDPAATAKRFEQFLQEIFAGDTDAADKRRAVLEMVGYTLMAHCSHERFVLLLGPAANGKSVLLGLIEALCGSDNVAGVQPGEFANKFQRGHLQHKLANIVSETRQGEVIDDAAMKAIVSGEATTVEHKFQDPFTMRPFATVWLGTNHMPHTRDFSDALFRRALVIECTNIFKPELGNCDPHLKDKLLAELPGVLNLSLQAYSRAVVEGFTTPASSHKAREDWRLEADQVAQFVDDQCRRDPHERVQASTLYERYREWCIANGVQRTVAMKTFRDRLTRQGFGHQRTKYAKFVTGLDLTGGIQ